MGENPLEESESHHARDVLRLNVGDDVELFDDAGAAAAGVIEQCDSHGVVIRVAEILAQVPGSGVTVASAVPKGERADWMVEKLSELGVDRFIPLRTARSVVHPTGKSKSDRWQRIATESAKQSRRRGVMRIDALTPLDAVLAPSSPAAGVAGEGTAEMLRIFLSTDPAAPPLIERLRESRTPILLLIGPEGGWTDAEVAAMRKVGLTPARLTATILRVETAAVAAAAIACALPT